MSNAEVIALIDAVLARSVSDLTKSDLRSFRLQMQAGTIAEDDRNYIIKLCQRLQQGKGETSVLRGVDDNWVREEAENRRKRSESLHQTGTVFESTADLKWLYFHLALSGALGPIEEARPVPTKPDFLPEFSDIIEKLFPHAIGRTYTQSPTERELSDFIREPIWESIYWRGGGRTRSDALITQAARYVDRPLFHCTALRDFFIVRLTESLLTHVRDPIKDRLVLALRPFTATFLIVLTIAMYIFVNWWTAAIVAFVFASKVWGWLKQIDNISICKIRNRLTRNKIDELVAILKRGGFDEPTIIRHLEVLDYKFPPLPKLVYIYGCPYLLGPNQTGEGIQEHTIPAPDVLYALLRLPRRNVQREIASIVFALDEQKRDELTRRWRQFIDPMLTHDEPQPSRT
jgi:hypothetical protein